jgi:hypothetical protein
MWFHIHARRRQGLRKRLLAKPFEGYAMGKEGPLMSGIGGHLGWRMDQLCRL